MLIVISSSVRSWTSSAISALVVGEGDGLPADREVTPLRPADVVVGKQDPGQVGVASEENPEEVEGLALLEVGGGEQLDARVDFRQRRPGGHGSCHGRGPTTPCGS